MRNKFLLVFTSLVLASSIAHAGPAASVAQLGWMTGTWTGALGPNTLEENWIAPANGSIAAMVRMSSASGIGMWEVITIEEKDGSLVMNVQQWSAGFEPRTPLQTLELGEIGEQSVRFDAVTEGSVKSLGYSRNGNSFVIEVGRPDNNITKLELHAQ